MCWQLKPLNVPKIQTLKRSFSSAPAGLGEVTPGNIHIPKPLCIEIDSSEEILEFPTLSHNIKCR
jgi:hypothetical protein